MKYVMTNKLIRFFNECIPAKSIIPVEETGGMWKIIDGPYEGRYVKWRDAGPFPVYQELLQRREEVAGLTENVRQKQRGIQDLTAASNRLLINIIQLRREVNEAKEAKQVSLPREVAEAIDSFRTEYWADMQIMQCAVSPLDNTTNRALAIRKFARDNLNAFILALVYGYTVEETEEERNRNAIRNWYQGALARIEDGRDPDGFAKEAVEEVALYLGGAEILADLSGFCRHQLAKSQAANG